MIKEFLPKLLEAVHAASERILSIYETDFEVALKEDDSPVTIADKASNEILMACLEETAVMIVSEESQIASYDERKDKDIWLVDPLDGTKDFIRKNGEFCICIAFIQNQQAKFGLIASPIQGEIIFGGDDIRAAKIPFDCENPFDPKYYLEQIKNRELNAVIYSRTQISPRIDRFIEQQSQRFGHIDRIKKGSALKFFDLVENKAQAYIRLWPTMEWDIAAGHAIYKSIGGEVIDFANFKPLKYNKEDLHNPQFIAKPITLNLLQ